MNPNAMRTVTIQLFESIEMNTAMFGEYGVVMPPELYAHANWFRKFPPARC